jgi:adenosylcobyric acid synthase
MSNNSFVVENGEMGRAQVDQAWAAGVTPHVDMNPILLKPLSNTNSQVILNGKVWNPNSSAKNYFNSDSINTLYQECVSPALNRLRNSNDLVIIEGAGSCAEINFWDKDLIHWRVAETSDAKVIIVGDISACGIFAQLLGTYNLLPPEYKKRVCGFLVNKFRGDPDLFADGVEFLERQTRVPVLGVIPMNRELHIDSEDGLMPGSIVDPPFSMLHQEKINVGVILLPHASNITDFHPLEREPSVNLHYLYKPTSLSNYQLVLLPGTKNTLADLRWLKKNNWHSAINQVATFGSGMIGGICGGYQILGNLVSDPENVEGGGAESGLELLNVETILLPEKTLRRVNMSCWLEGLSEKTVLSGYEIHTGITNYSSSLQSTSKSLMEEIGPALPRDVYAIGAQSPNGKIWGSYVHGLFDEPEFRHALLRSLCPTAVEKYGVYAAGISISEFREQQYEVLARHFFDNMDIPLLENSL